MTSSTGVQNELQEVTDTLDIIEKPYPAGRVLQPRYPTCLLTGLFPPEICLHPCSGLRISISIKTENRSVITQTNDMRVPLPGFWLALQ
jgi:hypothetical protein